VEMAEQTQPNQDSICILLESLLLFSRQTNIRGVFPHNFCYN